MTCSVDQHFEGRSPSVRVIYEALLEASRRFGSLEEHPKKTSIHLNRKTAFAGVKTRKDHLILTLKSDRDIPSHRVLRSERTSANRWHAEFRIHNADEIDNEMRAWLEKAYALSG